jgi:hypothetical protein
VAVRRGLFIIYIAASASWLASLFASPTLGALFGVLAAWGFWRVAQGFDAWNRQRRRMSYGLAASASRGAAVATALTSLAVASWLASAPQISPLDAWGARLLLYAAWTGLWILYYYALQVKLEDLGAEHPLSRYPMTFTALGLSVLLSPVLTEGLPAPPEAKLVLAASLYAGYLPPLNISTLLAAYLAR